MITAEEWIARSWTNFADFIREIQSDALEEAATIIKSQDVTAMCCGCATDAERHMHAIRLAKPRAKWSNPNST